MKSIIMLCILSILLSFSNTVYSRSIHKFRFYDVIRKTANKNTDTILLEVRPHKFVHPTTATHPSPTTTITATTTSTVTTTSPLVTEQSQSNESEDQIELNPRDSWDSEEAHYFKWASQNRRPMESLAGRKRSIKKQPIKH